MWQAVQRAIRYAQNKGVLTIASAGNSTSTYSTSSRRWKPQRRQLSRRDAEINGACLDLPPRRRSRHVPAVGTQRLKSYYSSYGQGVVDVAAPGGDTRQPNPAVSTIANAVLSSVINTVTKVNGWGYMQGVDGQSARGRVAALALSAHPNLQPAALAAFLERTADPLPCPEGVYNPRPGLDQYLAECSGGNRNGFYGAGEVNAANAVK